MNGQFIPIPLEIRFWRHVDRRGPDECWPWIGYRNERGYGKIRIGDRLVFAHRVVFGLVGQPLTSDQLVRHRCNNPPCVNPRHVVPGTPSENMADCVAAGRHNQASKTHCPQGHPYDKQNTYLRRDGWRNCRACVREASKRYLPKRRQRYVVRTERVR